MPEASQIIARRIGRIAFGGVLLAGVAYLIAAACAHGGDLLNRDDLPPFDDPSRFHAARIVVLTWLAAASAGVAATRVAAWLRIGGHPDQLFAESLIAPTLGVALLLPITLHMPVVMLIGNSEWFDIWVYGSLWVTGLTHAVFAGTCALRAHHLVAGKPPRSPRSIYIATVVTSCVPFVLLYGIPPVIVAITALPFIPLLRAMEGLVGRERSEIAGAMHPLPRAIVRLPPEA